MAHTYFRATRSVAALVLSRSRTLQLSVIGVGLSVFVGQRLSRLRDADREAVAESLRSGAPEGADAPGHSADAEGDQRQN